MHGLHVRLTRSLPLVHPSGARIEQVFWNVLKNAAFLRKTELDVLTFLPQNAETAINQTFTGRATAARIRPIEAKKGKRVLTHREFDRKGHVPTEQSSDVKFEIGHVLFIDIVGYSKLLITEQSNMLEKPKEIRGTEQFLSPRLKASCSRSRRATAVPLFLQQSGSGRALRHGD